MQPVFEAIAERSNRLVNGLSTAVYRLVDDTAHLMAFTPVSPEADAALQALFPAPALQIAWGEAISKGETYFLVDAEVEFAARSSMLELARLRGWRSSLAVPLIRERRPIGVITVTRVEPGRFDDHHVQLLKTFADQAVIAIENVRLFDEVQAKTRDLTESLEQQTATSEVLGVISNSAGANWPQYSRRCWRTLHGLRPNSDDVSLKGTRLGERRFATCHLPTPMRLGTNVSTSSERRPWPSDQHQKSGSYRGCSDEPGIPRG